MADLVHSRETFELDGVTFLVYEANEGKNKSDMVGSLAKGAIARGLASHEGEVRSAEAVAALIRGNLHESTEKFDFIEIIVVPEFERAEIRDEVPCEGIRNMHSFALKPDGNILAEALACTFCTVEGMCAACLEKPANVLKSKMKRQTKKKKAEEENEA